MGQRLVILSAIALLLVAGLACSRMTRKAPLTWSITLEIDAPSADRDSALSQTTNVLETRLNAFGLSNFQLAQDANSSRIIVRLPEVPDRERFKKVITSAGRLELTHVISPSSPSPAQTFNSREQAVASLGGSVPQNRRVLPYTISDRLHDYKETSTQDSSTRWVVVEVPAIVDGTELRDATAVQSPVARQEYNIAFSLKAAGAKKFGAWTGSHVNQYVGVVLDDEVQSITFIKSQIFDSGQIDGRFTKQSAEDLAQILKSGALPLPVRIVEVGANKQ